MFWQARAWLTSFLSLCSGTELWSGRPQTLLPARWNPFDLRSHRHRPVPESKGGCPWALEGRCGSLHWEDVWWESLRPGLCLASMGEAGDSQECTVGRLRRWGIHLWQIGWDSELTNARCISKDRYSCLDVRVPWLGLQTVGSHSAVKDKKVKGLFLGPAANQGHISFSLQASVSPCANE